MESYLGFIYLSALNFTPRAFAPCAGALLPISQNAALFSLLGTNFGGDGRTTFQLPDMRGRVPVGAGNAPGLSDYRLGQRGGVEGVTLNSLEMPTHNHVAATAAGQTQTTLSGTLNISPGANSGDGTTNNPVNNFPAQIPNLGKSAVSAYATTANDSMGSHSSAVSGNVNLELPQQSVTVGMAGGSTAHENRQPFLVLNYAICTQGLFPPRN